MNIINTIAVIITLFIAVFTFLKALMEYVKQGKLKRAELLEKYRGKFSTGKYFFEITRYIEEDDKRLMKIERVYRYDYLCFFEEISVLLNSGIFRKEIIYYFFGYYAIKTSESKNFWFDIDIESEYLQEFKRFVDTMRDYEDKVVRDKEIRMRLLKV